MKNCLAFIVLACLAPVLLCCKKHSNATIVDRDSDSLIDKHFNYKAGSYWVYKDSLSGRIDCFYVKQNYYVAQGDGRYIYNYHFVSISEVNMDGTKTADSAEWILNYNQNQVILDYYYGRSGYGWKSDITYNPLFLYPYVIGDNRSTFDTAKVLTEDSVLYVSGKPYYNVATVQQFIHLDSSAGPGLTYIDDLFLVNDSVGMLSMKLYHPYDSINHLWLLQRYKLAKYY